MRGFRLAMSLAMVLASSGMACTVIVLGKLDRISDYGLDDGSTISSSSSGTSGTSGTSGGDERADPCSILADPFGKPLKSNPCAECIEQQCAAEVDDACDTDGSTTTKQTWLGNIKRCAQNPWFAYPDPEYGSSSWGCRPYIDAGAELSGTDLASRERRSERCITSKCMQGKQPKCYLCEITTKKPGSGNETAYLRDDDCGKCIVENCKDDIVACCGSQVVSKYLEPCSYTDEDPNRKTCSELVPDNVGDGGDKGGFKLDLFAPSSFDRACALRLSQCIKDNCTDTVAKCRAP